MHLCLATAPLKYFGTVSLAERCFCKAVALACSEDDLIRLKEFFETSAPDMVERCRPILLAIEQKVYSTDKRKIQLGDKDS